MSLPTLKSIPAKRSRSRLGSLIRCSTFAFAISSFHIAEGSEWQTPHAAAGSELSQRVNGIHWPRGFDPSTAQSFSHNELVIEANCSRVWNFLSDANSWQSWLTIAKNVHLIDAVSTLGMDTRFSWDIFGITIESRVGEYVPETRLGWFSHLPGHKPDYYHTWYLTQSQGGCRVVTEEVGLGADAAQATLRGDSRTHRAHDLWLASLKWIAES